MACHVRNVRNLAYATYSRNYFSNRVVRSPRNLFLRTLSSSSHESKSTPPTVTICGKQYQTDPKWFNIPANVLESATRRLHRQKDHPIHITRQIIESHFPATTFRRFDDFSPVVTTRQNFDSLGFPPDHPGRARSDTYYINDATLLRTHTSAHQAEAFRANGAAGEGYLVTADVFRRDAIDRHHYPAFHQMEGARYWDRARVSGGDVAATVLRDLEALPRYDAAAAVVEDPSPPWHPERNPVQEEHHSAAEVEAIGAHLKRSLENMVVDVFSRARTAAKAAAAAQAVDASERDASPADEPLRMRWTESYFPFTSPSWELEVLHAGDWVEVLGCGVVRQHLFAGAGAPSKLGWAFGVGIDRIAMLLFRIPDIRLFWSRDDRFASQFVGVSDRPDSLRTFVPFSKYPPCPRDVSFWLPDLPSGSTLLQLHLNDVMELVRSVAGDVVEDVALIDEFTSPRSGRRSMAFRIVYRSLEKTLMGSEANEYHESVRQSLVDKFGVELR